MKSAKIDRENLTANMIWGKVISYLREKKYISLHIACGDIINVEIINNDFCIYPKEKYLEDIIRDETNLDLLKKAFKSVDKEYNIVIIKQETKSEILAKEIKALQQLADNKLIIINKENE